MLSFIYPSDALGLELGVYFGFLEEGLFPEVKEGELVLSHQLIDGPSGNLPVFLEVPLCNDLFFQLEYLNKSSQKTKELSFFRPIVREVVERYLDCGNLRCRFARIRLMIAKTSPSPRTTGRHIERYRFFGGQQR